VRGMATLELHGLRKSFGPIDVLHGIDLSLADGEMLVIVGASGCGKSTLLRLVAGLERPTAGRVVLEGRDVTQLDPSERDIAMVFQNYALYPHMTVFDNMAYGLRIRGLSRADIRTRVDEAAVLLGLGELLARKPRQLSGGQRQRVAMGRAIVRHPKLFLFDEPLSNLDAKLRLAMRAEIRRLQRRLGVTSLFVTHDQVEAMTLGDRLLVLHQGRPAQLASPMEIFSCPADTYVAGFIGAPTMNFLPATLARGGAAALLDTGLLLPFADGRRPGTDGDKLTVGIRPEHLVPGVGLEMAIDLVEPLGSETLVHGRLDGGDPLVVKLLGPSAGGERLSVAPQVEHMHVFDRASGQRIDPVGEENRASRLAAADTAD
jgi:sn-glycerol 3-phosphate transport system ATP-binding protein